MDVRIHKSLAPAEHRKAEIAFESTRRLLKSKNLEWVIDLGPVTFDLVQGGGGVYDPTTDGLTVDPTQFNTVDLVKALLHELGHRLHLTKLPLLASVKVLWKHFRGKEGWHPNPYSKQNHHEMFAEMFRLHAMGDLPEEQENWMQTVLSKARRTG